MSEGTFDLSLPEPVVKKARQPPSSRVTWTKYRPANPVHCDDCLAEVHELWPVSMIPRRALHKRTAGDRITYHCAAHHLAQKALDNVKAKRHTK